MKDVRIDRDGELRCWKCGSKNFENKRTFRAKAIGGVAGVATLGLAGAAAPAVTKKKLRCQACGEYNQIGNAKPYEDPVAATSSPRVRTDAPHQDADVNALRAGAQAALNSAPATFKGYGSSVEIGDRRLEITHNGLTAKLRGAKTYSEALSDITGVKTFEPTMMTNGWVHILTHGTLDHPYNKKAPPLGGGVVAFTYQRRGDMAQFVGLLRSLAAVGAAEWAAEHQSAGSPTPVAIEAVGATAGGAGDIASRLATLDGLHGNGLVTDVEYLAKRAEILHSL